MSTTPQLVRIPQLAQQYADQQAALGPAPADLAPDSMSYPLAKMPTVQTAQPRIVGPSPEDRQIANDQARLEKIRWAQQNPWGTENNHPGKLGKLAHIFSEVGNIAGDVFAPDVMARIPGTQLNREMQEEGLSKRLNEETKNEAQEEEQGAQAEKAKEDTALEPEKTASEEKLQGAQAANLQSEADERNTYGPALGVAYGHAVQQAIKEGRDPMADPIVQHLSDAITSIQKQSNTPGTKTVQLEVGGKPHQVLIDERSGNLIKDLGESGEKPPTVKVETPHEQFGEKQALLKLYEPAQDSAERFNVMTKNYEDAIKNHDQQAMLSLLANHLGMTMGLQKGARLTKDIISEAKESRPWLQGIQAKFDKDGYLTGVTLSPEQMRQMVDLGRERFAEDMVKANNEAGYMGAAGEGPERTPNKSTINHYVFLAGGDINKAKQLAEKDGWSIK